MLKGNSYALLLILLLLLIQLNPAEGADWRMYAKEAPLERGIVGNAYYDKDSIAYPFETKGFFGMKKDKSIISIWTKYVFPRTNREMRLFSYVSCRTREIILKSIISDGHYIYPPFLNRTFGIEPNTTDEKLYKILCR